MLLILLLKTLLLKRKMKLSNKHFEVIAATIGILKEQSQEDLITLMNSDDKELNDKVSQIFGKFNKFFPKVK